MSDPLQKPSPSTNASAVPAAIPPAVIAPKSASQVATSPGVQELSEKSDVELIELLQKRAHALRTELRKRIVGQENVIELLLIALFARGHGLFVGVPGLAKTLLISTLAEGLGLSFNRIQFTPDLMPTDITGTDVLEEDQQTGRRSFRFIEGPLFANVLLADEINRTPPKTQAALLEAMQERRVTAGGKTRDLDKPFMVFATQNPIEQEGTYPLPEAQLDRFMFMIDVGYPSEEEEVAIVHATTVDSSPQLSPALTQEEVVALQDLVRRVPAPEHVVRYAVRLCRSTRPVPAGEKSTSSVGKDLSWGAGPRASQYLILGAKARCALRGSFSASIDDVKAVAEAVLQHRIVVSFAAAAKGVSAKDVIARLLDEVRSPEA
ncbi:MAG: MoxR family ATPase [Deltaproteobacteria bacterium]|nr:MoxR family ATPase [Deltaproteobacteria bacterium]